MNTYRIFAVTVDEAKNTVTFLDRVGKRHSVEVDNLCIRKISRALKTETGESRIPS